MAGWELYEGALFIVWLCAWLWVIFCGSIGFRAYYSNSLQEGSQYFIAGIFGLILIQTLGA